MAPGGRKTGRASQRADEDREAGLCLTLPARMGKDTRSILMAISVHGSAFPAGAGERAGGTCRGRGGDGWAPAASKVSPADEQWDSLTCGAAL